MTAPKKQTVKRKIITRFRRSRRRNKLTPIRVGKWAIAIAPTAALAYQDWKTNGPTIATANAVLNYVPIDITTGKWRTDRLMIGYVPLLAAWIFGKFAGRVLR